MPKTRPLTAALAATLLIAALGCRAQVPAAAAQPGTPLPIAQARRVEILVRQKANLPPESTVNVGPRTPSELAGYDTVEVTVASDGKVSHPIRFLLSRDGKTLAQFTKYDISADPRGLVSAADRPARGGPLTAPVLFVNFDDLECPFCARLNASIFPAITERYGDKVRIVYRDYPLDQHPWAMHAAVDVNCLAAQSPEGYWNLVDGIHAHAADISASAQAAAKPGDKNDTALKGAYATLDSLTLEQGKIQKVDVSRLNACIVQQDKKAIETSKQLGDSLGVESTPSMFINGDKIEGAVPLDFIFNTIDDALRAEGQTPPPPYVAPKAPTPAPAAAPKPGN